MINYKKIAVRCGAGTLTQNEKKRFRFEECIGGGAAQLPPRGSYIIEEFLETTARPID